MKFSSAYSPNIVNRADVSIIQGGCGPSFSPESFVCRGISRQFGREEFEGNVAAEPHVLGLEDQTHAAATDLFNNAVLQDCVANCNHSRSMLPLNVSTHKRASVNDPNPPQNGHIVPGAFTPVLAKHSKNFSLQDSLAIGVDRMQRNFEPMRWQTEQWRQQQLSNATAKLLIYRAFIEGDFQAPKHLAGVVHDLYFNPKYEEFQPRTMWSLSNAFTSAFKELEPIPQFKATAKLGAFLETTAPLISERAA